MFEVLKNKHTKLMPKLTINSQEVEVQEGLTVMQACQSIGVEIPHFCFHEKLQIAGNCRMCLVEMERSPKPIASCAMPISEGMVINTNTPKIQKAREGVMEFLLINHPLDCPICDQGGECDLQDQAFKYGRGKNRYTENKRSVNDKNLGSLIKTHMTRCIHCTRCIRFATEIAGVEEIGAINRGEDMEITSYLEKTITSELSGNIIDLCPVGALTSKPYAFKARSWELNKTESIDVMDAVGSNIRIDSKGLEVMRILPKINEKINEQWLSDKARFSYDGLKIQRLDSAYIRKSGKLFKTSTNNAINAVVDKIKSVNGNEIAAIAGTTTPCEAMFLLKKTLNQLGSHYHDANQFGYEFDTSYRDNYLFNTTIERINEADLCLLIGANPRQHAPVLNARIGQSVRANTMKVYNIGNVIDQHYKIQHLGSDVSLIEEILRGIHKFTKELTKAQNPMLIIGSAVLSRRDANKIITLIQALCGKYKIIRKDWNGLNILHEHASMVGALDLGFHLHDNVKGTRNNGVEGILKGTQKGTVKVLYLLAADDFDFNQISEDTFVIYQGHHGDNGANRADIILPSTAYTEEDGIFVNLEGRPQYARRAVLPVVCAEENWQIIHKIAQKLNISFGIGALSGLRAEMAKEHPIFAKINNIVKGNRTSLIKNISKIKLNNIKLDNKKLIISKEINYYMTDPISRASVTMARCMKTLGNAI